MEAKEDVAPVIPPESTMEEAKENPQGRPSLQQLQLYDEESLKWFHQIRSERTKFLDFLTTCGSVGVVVRLLEFLFRTRRVQDVALELFMDLFQYFPEAASKEIHLFQQYQYWQELLKFFQMTSRCKRHKLIHHEVNGIVLHQLRHDLRSYAKAEYGRISDLVLYLPKDGKQRRALLSHHGDHSKLPCKIRLDMSTSKYEARLYSLRNHVLQKSQTRSSDECSSTDSSNPLPVVLVFQVPGGTSLNGDSSSGCSPIVPNGVLSSSSPLVSIPEVLQGRAILAAESNPILQGNVRCFGPASTERILYIHQGEVGHAFPSQCDVIVSDRATTCHIVAFRSTSQHAEPLASLTHIGAPNYDACLATILETHIQHHFDGKPVTKKKSKGKIKMTIDIVGGFNDALGLSKKLSLWLVQVLSQLAEEHRGIMEFRVRTSAFTECNDNGHQEPIGRGMGMDLSNGEVFLAKVDESVMGPAFHLRAARIWAGATSSELALVHTASDEGSNFVIDPFEFRGDSKLVSYLKMDDSTMLRCTSTSPTVEESDFCLTVRNTLRYMRLVDCGEQFGPAGLKRLVFSRVGKSNLWHR